MTEVILIRHGVTAWNRQRRFQGSIDIPLEPEGHAEAEQAAVKAREMLREQVAGLAVKGAEQILRREVNAGVHAELLGRLKAEL